MKSHPWPPIALLALALLPAPPVPSAPRTAGAAGTGTTTRIDFGKDAIQPTSAQTAAIRRAAASAIQEFIHPKQPGYVVAQADLNEDGRPDLLVQFDDGGFCASSGCSGVIVMATPNGYADKPIGLPNFGGEIDILPSMHHGMHDLRYDGDSPVWKWNGKQYQIDPADLPGANASPWATRQAAGRTLALVVPIDSTIMSVSVFCDQGKPVLATLLKASHAAGAMTMSLVFRGWTVNVPMSQGNRDATLWMADFSGSELPRWLAHRGSNATTSELAGLATEAFLRIDGGMQGEISLKDSTRATQAALGACYRY